MKKYKIKTHPVSQKVLRGPVKAAEPVAKKRTTVPVPFAITYPPPKKVAPSSPDKFEFRSRSAPKYLGEQSLKLVREAIRPPTKEPGKIKTECAPPEKKKPIELTKVKPFTFEEPDKNSLWLLILIWLLEEEKRSPEFHARSMPKLIYKGASSKRSVQESRENVGPQIKLRTPVMLAKEPKKSRGQALRDSVALITFGPAAHFLKTVTKVPTLKGFLNGNC